MGKQCNKCANKRLWRNLDALNSVWKARGGYSFATWFVRAHWTSAWCSICLKHCIVKGAPVANTDTGKTTGFTTTTITIATAAAAVIDAELTVTTQPPSYNRSDHRRRQYYHHHRHHHCHHRLRLLFITKYSTVTINCSPSPSPIRGDFSPVSPHPSTYSASPPAQMGEKLAKGAADGWRWTARCIQGTREWKAGEIGVILTRSGLGVRRVRSRGAHLRWPSRGPRRRQLVGPGRAPSSAEPRRRRGSADPRRAGSRSRDSAATRQPGSHSGRDPARCSTSGHGPPSRSATPQAGFTLELAG